VAAGLTGIAVPAWAHSDAGPVTPPQAPPAVALTLHDDSSLALRDVLLGRLTALQLMFTSCQATCPIQGALFGETAKKLGSTVEAAQLLSVSIDPGQDTPAALRAWLRRFGVSPRWRAARPQKDQIEGLITFLKSKKAGADPHSAQVYFFNRKGELVMRSTDFPPAADVIRTLTAMARKS
jgi:protein SCO1/2